MPASRSTRCRAPASSAPRADAQSSLARPGRRRGGSGGVLVSRRSPASRWSSRRSVMYGPSGPVFGSPDPVSSPTLSFPFDMARVLLWGTPHITPPGTSRRGRDRCPATGRNRRRRARTEPAAGNRVWSWAGENQSARAAGPERALINMSSYCMYVTAIRATSYSRRYSIQCYTSGTAML